jgi:hypothetical protein
MSEKRPNRFKTGDLVRVLQGTDDARMPKNRCGLVIEAACDPAWNDESFPVGIYKLWMTNGETLRFHEMFLERIERVNEKD